KFSHAFHRETNRGVDDLGDRATFQVPARQQPTSHLGGAGDESFEKSIGARILPRSGDPSPDPGKVQDLRAYDRCARVANEAKCLGDVDAPVPAGGSRDLHAAGVEPAPDGGLTGADGFGKVSRGEEAA